MTNTEELKRKIEASGLKISFIANKCGMTRATFYNRMNGEKDFTASEILTLRALLDLTRDEVEAIFFADGVEKNSRLLA